VTVGSYTWLTTQNAFLVDSPVVETHSDIDFYVFKLQGQYPWVDPVVDQHTQLTPNSETESSRFVFCYSNGASLVTEELPDPGDTFLREWPYSCGGASSPYSMYAWLDVFSSRGVISIEPELGYGPKKVISSLGKYAPWLSSALIGGIGTGVYGGMTVSGWFGVPFISEDLAKAVKQWPIQLS
jgi:hypothetical protein